MIIGGTVLIYMGLERFLGKRGTQIHNDTLLAVFILFHSCFAFIVPNLTIRTLLISLALLLVCFQCAWLMLLSGIDAESAR